MLDNKNPLIYIMGFEPKINTFKRYVQLRNDTSKFKLYSPINDV